MDSLEHNQFLNQIVSSKAIDVDKQLVEVAGIFYHYQLDQNQPIQAHRHYKITKVNGNQMTLTLMK